MQSPSETDVSVANSNLSKQKRAKRVILSVAGASIIAGLAWYVQDIAYGQYMKSTNNAYISADTVTVSPKIAGYVDEVYVSDNETVREGQPLVRVDRRNFEALADQSRGQIAVAHASAQAIAAQRQEQAAAIDRAIAEEQAARADALLAQKQVSRYTPLAAQGLETPEKLDQLRNQLAQANARLQSSAMAVESARRRVATLNAQWQQAQAQGDIARAQLRSANEDLGSVIIRASVAGRVGNKAIRVGQYVQAGTRMLSLVPANLYVDANFKETQVGLIRLGQPVSIEVDAMPGISIAGRVESLSPATGSQFSILPPQNASGNFTKVVQRVPVRISMKLSPQMRARLVPGMSAEVTVDTRSARNERKTIEQGQQKANEQGGQ